MTEKKHPGFTPKPKHTHQPLRFPEGFLWGAATSAHQVEGWNDNNDWWYWEQESGTIADGQVSGRSTDHYHLYKEDFDLVEKLNNNAHRLSIEWSRVQPNPGEFDRKQIEHYRKVLQNLKKRNIKVMLTLHHFTNPVWFAQKGGFLKQRNIDYFITYAKRMVEEYYDLVDFWVTINEPNIYSIMSYSFGLWPPGEHSVFKAYRVFRNMAIAHKRCYSLIHEIVRARTTKVGIAHNVISFYTYNKHSLSEWASVRIADWVWNHSFMEMTEGYHDYLGVNYYVHKRAKDVRLKNWEHIIRDNQGEGRERSDLEWEIFAPGFFDALVDMSSYQLPIYVTENGISTLNDDRRSRYLVSYLKELYHAIQSGVDVRGYFFWSLLDNFEWDKGYKSKFGLVSVNLKTLKRTIRGSGKIYAKIAEENEIDHDLLRFIGHSVSAEDVL